MTATRVQGGIFTVMVVRITDPYDPALDADLKEQVARSPGFFLDAPVVLDLKDCIGCTSVADYVQLKTVLRRHRLIPVGVANASQIQQRAAGAVDLAPFNPAGSGRRTAEPPQRAPVDGAEMPQPKSPPRAAAAERPAQPAPGPAAATRPRLVTQPVRSGTQIYARGGDLIVTAPVSAGAEVIADGNVHIYGALRGRAIAGASGDESARLFVQRLEAELICVAGRYLVSEAIPAEHLHHPVQVALVEEELRIVPGWGRSPGDA
jgi:septum site-determining protein MinC